MIRSRAGKGLTKPGVGVAINYSHHLAKGLTDYWLLGESSSGQTMNLVTGVISSSSSIPPAIGSLGGMARAFDGATSSRFLDNAVRVLPDGTAYTVWALCVPKLGGVIQEVLDADSVTRMFQLRFNASNQFEFITFNTSATPFVATGSAMIPNTLTSIAGTVDNTVTTVWGNGVKMGSVSVTGTILSSATPIRIGRRQAAAFQDFTGDILAAARWNRVLTDSEIASLSASPYSLLLSQGPDAQVLAPSSGAGGGMGNFLLLGVGGVLAWNILSHRTHAVTRRGLLTMLLALAVSKR